MRAGYKPFQIHSTSSHIFNAERMKYFLKNDYIIRNLSTWYKGILIRRHYFLNKAIQIGRHNLPNYFENNIEKACGMKLKNEWELLEQEHEGFN